MSEVCLIVGWYDDPAPTRAAELCECLRRNADHPRVSAIHLFLEVSDVDTPIAHQKIQPMQLGRRLTFADALQFANTRLSGRITIIANTDIYFDETLDTLTQYDLSGHMLCLSRWDDGADGVSRLFDNARSQDAWVFRPPIPTIECSFPLGVPGCDNRFAAEADRAGLIVSNPSRTVRAHHLHMSGIRRYQKSDQVPGPYLALPPANLTPPERAFNSVRPARDDSAEPKHVRSVRTSLISARESLRRNELEQSVHAKNREFPAYALDVPRVKNPNTNAHQLAASRDAIYALTSLSPASSSEASQRAAILSWRRAGLIPISFNRPNEISSLAQRYDIDFFALDDATESVFGQSFVPIHIMVEWANCNGSSVIIINADIELDLTPQQMRRFQLHGSNGLVYFVRWNHDGVLSRASREAWGIDAFLFHGRNRDVIADSILCMGQPWWDYWLPAMFARSDRPIYAVEHPVAFHRNHPRAWSDTTWNIAAFEFDRLTGELGSERTHEACVAMATRLRQMFDQYRRNIPERPMPIREWVSRRFSDVCPKTFFELGAHIGSDTEWMANLPFVTVHAFEPDPRNQPISHRNVVLTRAAVAERDGRAPFILSQSGWGREWTYSSSLRRPRRHLERYPVVFGDTIEVETVSLDSYCRRAGIGKIDFIWADVQGAEGDMIRGGCETLGKTRYLYTAYSDDEMYDGQVSLAEILELLPGFRVLEIYEDDVLLENTRSFG